MITHKAFFAATLFAVGIPVFAAEVTIAPSRDTTLFEYDGTYGCGDGPLFAGQTGAFGIRRALIRFDVAAAVPAGSTIQSVSLEFYVAQSGPFATITDLGTLHRVVSNWGEGASVCFLGDGVPAETGDATWTYSFYNSSFWTTAGGDFAALASASAAMPLAGSSKFDSTAAMVADVQGWLDTPATNYGWVLRVNEVPARSARKILSREEQDEVNSGPMLNIVFAPPVNTPPAVPDGRTGVPFRIAKVGTDLQLTWDTTSCTGCRGPPRALRNTERVPGSAGRNLRLAGERVRSRDQLPLHLDGLTRSGGARPRPAPDVHPRGGRQQWRHRRLVGPRQPVLRAERCGGQRGLESVRRPDQGPRQHLRQRALRSVTVSATVP